MATSCSETRPAKRHFDDSEETTPAHCSPHRVQFYSPAKRIRTNEQASNNPAGPPRDSHFPLPPDEEITIEKVEKFVGRKGRRVGNERMFTLEEVTQLIGQAVHERETGLRAMYDRILQERLAEQYQSFAKFTEDYLSRRFKDREFSYVS